MVTLPALTWGQTRLVQPGGGLWGGMYPLTMFCHVALLGVTCGWFMLLDLYPSYVRTGVVVRLGVVGWLTVRQPPGVARPQDLSGV